MVDVGGGRRDFSEDTNLGAARRRLLGRGVNVITGGETTGSGLVGALRRIHDWARGGLRDVVGRERIGQSKRGEEQILLLDLEPQLRSAPLAG